MHGRVNPVPARAEPGCRSPAAARLPGQNPARPNARRLGNHVGKLGIYSPLLDWHELFGVVVVFVNQAAGGTGEADVGSMTVDLVDGAVLVLEVPGSLFDEPETNGYAS